MRVAVLWTGLSGYLNACLKELSSRDGVELFVIHEASSEGAPFDAGQFKWIARRFEWSSKRDLRNLEEMLRAFDPEIMVIPSWHIPAYRRMGRQFANSCWRVMTMDHPWLGSLRQRFGTLISSVYVKPLADVVWLPGERQATFARKLGFSQTAILSGLYACDHSTFEAIHLARLTEGRRVPRKFLFVGRLVKDKGVDMLARAYQLYRRQTPAPWPLICCGSGPMRSEIENEDGIDVEGFVQPDKLPEVLGRAGCLILPSRVEPWGLVVHEAAASGRLIIASENVGSVPHLLQPGYNGFVFSSGDVAALAGLMVRVSTLSDTQMDEMSQASYSLSRQFSPRQWANILLESYKYRSPKLQRAHCPAFKQMP